MLLSVGKINRMFISTFFAISIFCGQISYATNCGDYGDDVDCAKVDNSCDDGTPRDIHGNCVQHTDDQGRSVDSVKNIGHTPGDDEAETRARAEDELLAKEKLNDDYWKSTMGQQSSTSASTGTAEAEACIKAKEEADNLCTETQRRQYFQSQAAGVITQTAGATNAYGAAGGSLAAGTMVLNGSMELKRCGHELDSCAQQCKAAKDLLKDAKDEKRKAALIKVTSLEKTCKNSADTVDTGSNLGIMNALGSMMAYGANAWNLATQNKNPFAPGTTPTIDPFPANTGTTASGLPDTGDIAMPTLPSPDDQKFAGLPSVGTPQKYDATGGGGGGGPSGAGAYGGAPVGAQAAAGGGGGAGMKDPGGNSFTTGGGGFVGGGGSNPFANNGRGGSGGGSDRPGMDLSQFLPCDPNTPGKKCADRGLASADSALRANGITGVNDISNFEKISRMMAIHQPRLRPQ